MIYGLYHSAAGMLVNQYRQDVIANNLANVDTASYKRDVPAFSERLIEARRRAGASGNSVLNGQTGGVWSASTATDWQAGPDEVTGNHLDAAIAGRGFFAVQTSEGVRYTRDGRFTTNAQGQLVTAQGGLPVLSDQGAAIQLGDDVKDAQLAMDGHVMVNGQPLAQLRVVDFDDAALRKVGANLVASDAVPQPVATQLRTGSIEKSNVDPMMEMVSMIEASRAYQLNAQMVTLQDGTLGELVNQVSKPVS